MPAPPLAHLDHCYVLLPVFTGPVLLVVIALKIHAWREHRHRPDQSGKRSSVTMSQDDDGGRARRDNCWRYVDPCKRAGRERFGIPPATALSGSSWPC